MQYVTDIVAAYPSVKLKVCIYYVNSKYIEAVPQLSNHMDTRGVLNNICISLQSTFFNQHGCTASETNAKYNSRAAQLYREKIKSLATQATRQHGTEVRHTNK